MTKIQLPFKLSSPLDEEIMNRLADVYRTYGILRIVATPGGDTVMVEYDATRFSPEDIQAALARAGIPLAVRSV